VDLVHAGSGKTWPMGRIAEAGVYEVVLPTIRKPFPYRFRIHSNDGDVYEREDPYRFGPTLSGFDLQLWGEGTHTEAYRMLGAHIMELDGVTGTRFSVVAPSAKRVSVVGPFNQWDGRVHVMRRYFDQGIWEIFLPGVTEGTPYKFEIASPYTQLPLLKAD